MVYTEKFIPLTLLLDSMQSTMDGNFIVVISTPSNKITLLLEEGVCIENPDIEHGEYKRTFASDIILL